MTLFGSFVFLGHDGHELGAADEFTELWRALIASDDADERRTNASPGRGSQPELTEELREQLRSLGCIP